MAAMTASQYSKGRFRLGPPPLHARRTDYARSMPSTRRTRSRRHLAAPRTNRRHLPRAHLSARQTYYYSVGRRRQAAFAKRASFVTCIMMMMMMTIVTGPL